LEYLAINPMGKVPAIDDGGIKLGESAAIMLYVADRYRATPMAPALDDPLRGRYLQWMLFTPACLEPAMAERFTGAQGNTFSFGWGDFGRVVEALHDGLSAGPWLLGERFSAADILVSSTLEVAINMKLLTRESLIGEYIDRAYQRPAHVRAMQIEEREIAAAAQER
jgi:glutathione S-transferase